MSDDEMERALAEGRQAWADGGDMPPYPAADDVTHEALVWVGFVEARSRDFFVRRKMALYLDTIEPRPPSPPL